jgi:uncharacterized protein (TIGR00369 family)
MALVDDLRALLEGSPFYRWSGIEALEADAGAVTLGLELADHHRNVQGFAHGGLLATLADAAMGLSVRTAMEPGRRHVTVEMNIHYLRPVTGGAITAAGTAMRVGTEIAYAEATVADASGRNLARASGTYSVTARRDQ